MTTTFGNPEFSDGTKPIEEMTLPELVELMHKIADEIQLRMMELAEQRNL